jgi:hypothetical protein
MKQALSRIFAKLRQDPWIGAEALSSATRRSERIEPPFALVRHCELLIGIDQIGVLDLRFVGANDFRIPVPGAKVLVRKRPERIAALDFRGLGGLRSGGWLVLRRS